MKKIVIAFVISCVAIAQGFCQEEKVKEENPNAPEITFTETIYDFGTLEYKALAECEFTFVNSGKEPLIIQNCPSTCGCTVPMCPKDKPIKKGDKETIKVKYNNTHISGPFSKQFTVYSNAKNSPVKITIKGVIGPKPEAVEVSAAK